MFPSCLHSWQRAATGGRDGAMQGWLPVPSILCLRSGFSEACWDPHHRRCAQDAAARRVARKQIPVLIISVHDPGISLGTERETQSGHVCFCSSMHGAALPGATRRPLTLRACSRRGRPAGPPKAFTELADTEVPALRQFVHRTVEAHVAAQRRNTRVMGEWHRLECHTPSGQFESFHSVKGSNR